MTADLSALIARLEAAEEVTRDLAVEFAAFMYADPEAFKGAVNYDPELWVERNQSPLCSLDAALALAERVLGRDQEYEITTLYNIARVTLNMNHDDVSGPFYGSNECCVVPLAICAATLRAKQGEV